jgi:hypothetical protein
MAQNPLPPNAVVVKIAGLRKWLRIMTEQGDISAPKTLVSSVMVASSEPAGGFSSRPTA